jgi:cyanophycin synthetase
LTIKLANLRFLQGQNLVAERSGAIITLDSFNPGDRLQSELLLLWLHALPSSLCVPADGFKGTLRDVIPLLLLTLTEHCRLNPAPAEVLREDSHELVVWLPVDSRQAAQASVRLLLHLVECVKSGRSPDSSIQEPWIELRRAQWNQTHAHLARAAQDLDIPFQHLDRAGQQMLQLGQGRHLRLCRETITDATPLIAKPAVDKQCLHALLRGSGIPLPMQMLVRSLDQAFAAAHRIGWPVVLKPTLGGKGRGVWVGLADASALAHAWAVQSHHGVREQLVQEMLVGHDHRLLVVDGKLLAAARRIPASLISDGKNTLRFQIDRLNSDPRRGVGYERILNRVRMDARLETILADQELSLDAIPVAGTMVQLSLTANLSQGGSAIDCTDHVHPDNCRLAEDIALLLHADVVGLDLISLDLSVSWRQGGTWLLEANLSPGLRPHLAANPESSLCRTMVQNWMAGRPRLGRIYTCWIAGADGHSISKIIENLLSSAGLRVGRVAGEIPELDGCPLFSRLPLGQDPVVRLLQDRRVDAVVVEAAEGRVANLSLDTPDVMALLDLQDPFACVAARSSRSCLVLNAADLHTQSLLASLPATSVKVVLIGTVAQSQLLQTHRLAGNTAITFGVNDGELSIFQANSEFRFSLSDASIAQSLNGTIPRESSFRVSVAVACIVGMGIDVRSIACIGSCSSSNR